jgi:hypothetical protein
MLYAGTIFRVSETSVYVAECTKVRLVLRQVVGARSLRRKGPSRCYRLSRDSAQFGPLFAGSHRLGVSIGYWKLGIS